MATEKRHRRSSEAKRHEESNEGQMPQAEWRMSPSQQKDWVMCIRIPETSEPSKIFPAWLSLLHPRVQCAVSERQS